MVKTLRKNGEIKSPKVLLIDEEGENLGEVEIEIALDRCAEAELDLVEVNSKGSMPTCKMMDYGKALYKRKVKNRKNHKPTRTQKKKEVRFTLSTSKHDVEVKTKQIDKFLKGNKKVRLAVKIPRQRAGEAEKLARDFLTEVLNCLKNEYVVTENSLNPSFYFMEISPRP